MEYQAKYFSLFLCQKKKCLSSPKGNMEHKQIRGTNSHEAHFSWQTSGNKLEVRLTPRAHGMHILGFKSNTANECHCDGL